MWSIFMKRQLLKDGKLIFKTIKTVDNQKVSGVKEKSTSLSVILLAEKIYHLKLCEN